MMGRPRSELQQNLEAMLGSGNVYFQPPPNVTMTYPCIVYQRDDTSVQHADDHPYRVDQAYQVTHISENPDSDVVDKLQRYPSSEFSRHFATSGLNHDVFVIYH